MPDEIGSSTESSTDAGQAAARRYGEKDRALADWQRKIRRQPVRPGATQEYPDESASESLRERTGDPARVTAHAETD